MIYACRFCCVFYTLCLKKVPTFKLSVTLSNLNRHSETQCSIRHHHRHHHHHPWAQRPLESDAFLIILLPLALSYAEWLSSYRLALHLSSIDCQPTLYAAFVLCSFHP